MLDTCGREVRTLRLSVTEACDLRCRYCMPGGVTLSRGAPLSAGEIMAIAQGAAQLGINKIRLTGGEPLIRNDIVEICEGISRIAGIASLCITTNGTRLAGLAPALAGAGVQRLNLSLDSLDESRYRSLTRGGELATVLAGLEAALAAGFERIKINCVLIGGVNDSEIEAFVALTVRWPVDVRFIELMPMGECTGWPPERFMHAEEVLQRCPMLAPIDAEGVAARYRLPGARGAVGLIRPMSHAFCGECDRIRITADGLLKPCLHSGTEINLRGLTGDALLQALAQGIGEKPTSHHLESGHSDTDRRMNQIGG